MVHICIHTILPSCSVIYNYFTYTLQNKRNHTTQQVHETSRTPTYGSRICKWNEYEHMNTLEKIEYIYYTITIHKQRSKKYNRTFFNYSFLAFWKSVRQQLFHHLYIRKLFIISLACINRKQKLSHNACACADSRTWRSAEGYCHFYSIIQKKFDLMQPVIGAQ